MVPQLVRGPVLMQDPEDLVGMMDQIGRELQADKKVYGSAGHFGQVQEAAGKHVVKDLFGRIPFEWNGDDLSLVALGNEGVPETFGMRFRPAADEWDLGCQDQNSHRELLAPGRARLAGP